ncbi:MAG TPA: lipopolysaccharide transport periplasmic protein LptA [Steroidobacteraceae bacterium]|nr:lipopolysaccharide transport periplasmic protein LptA [Steroidobacteraceae bacterium]
MAGAAAAAPSPPVVPAAAAISPAAAAASAATPAAAAPAATTSSVARPRPAAPSSEQPITVDAVSSEVDYRTNMVVFTQVVITQGDMRVQADHAHATGLNFANSRWTFEGHVRIDAEQRGDLRADQAVVEFRDNHITRATVTGKPAEFEQKRDDAPPARGHADEIVYDLNDGSVRLSDNAWLSDGQNEITGPLLIYNIRAQRVQAATKPGTDQRVHITITPHGLPASGKGDTAPKPPPGPQP